jgi:hypothetical protein
MNWYSRKKLGEAEQVRVYHPYPRRFDHMVQEGGIEVRHVGELLPPEAELEV